MAATASSLPESSSLNVVLKLLHRMAARTGGVIGNLIAGASLELVSVALSIAGPVALKTLIDDLAAGAAPAAIILCALAFVGSWGGGAVAANWRMVYSTRIIDKITSDLVEAMARDRLPSAATDRSGDSAASLGLIERLPYSMVIVVDGLIWRAVPLALQLLVTLLIVAGTIPLHYAAVLGLTMLGYATATWISASWFQRRASDLNAASAEVSQLTGDVFRNARRVVLNGALDTELALIGAAYRDKAAANRRMMWTVVKSSLGQYCIMALGLSVLFLLSGLAALNHTMTVGAFVLLQTYSFRLIVPVSGLGYILSQSATALANIREVVATTGKPGATSVSFTVPSGAAEISLQDVDFSYGPGLPGLTGITAEIPAGSFTVIVGANGSGKSTLAQVISGLLAPAAGTVRVGGIELSSMPLTERHKVALYVPQFIGLFNRSIAANALYPPTRHTEAELLQLLHIWQFHEPGSPMELASLVGEQGERLSGGQIQKLELARVAGIEAPAIILDESTSAMDPATELQVISSLRERFAGKTTLIMISHRQSVAERGDQVLFMRAGRILRKGTHAELQLDSGAYAALWSGSGE